MRVETWINTEKNDFQFIFALLEGITTPEGTTMIVLQEEDLILMRDRIEEVLQEV